MHDESVYIMDVYNRGIYPHDGYAKREYPIVSLIISTCLAQFEN